MSICMTPNELAYVVSIDDTRVNIGRLAKMQRTSLKLTQDQLARRCGATQTQIHRFEAKGDMTYDLFMRTCRSLGLDAWAVLKLAENPDAFEEACSLKSRFG